MAEKKIEIEGYGEVVLKKFSFRDRCELKGKIVKIEIDPLTKREKTTFDSGGVFFWTTALSIKSLPNHKNFYTYDEQRKADILGDEAISEYAEVIMEESMKFNSINSDTLKKKSP